MTCFPLLVSIRADPRCVLTGGAPPWPGPIDTCLMYTRPPLTPLLPSAQGSHRVAPPPPVARRRAPIIVTTPSTQCPPSVWPTSSHITSPVIAPRPT